MKRLIFIAVGILWLFGHNSSFVANAQSLQWSSILQTLNADLEPGAILDGAVNSSGNFIGVIQAVDSKLFDAFGQETSFNTNFNLIQMNSLGQVAFSRSVAISRISVQGDFIFKQLRVSSDDHIYISGIGMGSFNLILDNKIVAINAATEERKALLVLEFDQNGVFIDYTEISVALPIYDLFGFEIASGNQLIVSYALISKAIDEAEDEYELRQHVEVYAADRSLIDALDFSAYSQRKSAPIGKGFLLYAMTLDKEGSFYLSGYSHRGQTTDLSNDLTVNSNINGAILVKFNSDLDYQFFRGVTAFNASPSRPVIFSDNSIAMYVKAATVPSQPEIKLLGTDNLFSGRDVLGYESHIVKFDKNGKALWLNSVNFTLWDGVREADKHLAVDDSDDLYVPILVNRTSSAMLIQYKSDKIERVPLISGSPNNKFIGFFKFTNQTASESVDYRFYQGDLDVSVKQNYYLLPYADCQTFYLMGAFNGAIDLDFENSSKVVFNFKPLKSDYFLASYGNEIPEIQAEETTFERCLKDSLNIQFTYTDDDLATLSFEITSSEPNVLLPTDIQIETDFGKGQLIMPRGRAAGQVDIELAIIDGCGIRSNILFNIDYTESPQEPSLGSIPNLIELCEGQTFTLASNFYNNNLWSTGETTQSIEVTEAGKYWVKQVNDLGCESALSDIIEFVFYKNTETPIISASGPLVFCTGGGVILTTSLPQGAAWSTGETTSSITVTESGAYTVKQSSAQCGDSPESLPIEVVVSDMTVPPTISIMGDSRFCEGDEVILRSSMPNGNVWSTGETTQQIIVQTSGKYTVRTDLGSCQSSNSESVSIIVDEQFDATLNNDLTICVGGEEVELVPEVSLSGLDYLWSNGSTGSSLFITEDGEYWLQLTNGACSKRVFVQVEEACYPVLYVPEAFTPNGDGVNDKFEIFGIRITNFELRVYNKWGNLVFASTDLKQQWDGTYRGRSLGTGNYVYSISYAVLVQNKTNNYQQNGVVQLIL